MVCVAGIFAQHTQSHPLSSQVHVYKPAAYTSIVSPRSPGLLKLKLDPSIDLFIEFDPEDTTWEDADGLRLGDQDTYPYGLSGGGVFLVPPVPGDDSMWNPAEAKLVAIQSAFLPDKRLLRVKRAEVIRPWIEEYRRTFRVDVDSRLCGAITIGGKQCQRAPQRGKRVCWQHLRE